MSLEGLNFIAFLLFCVFVPANVLIYKRCRDKYKEIIKKEDEINKRIKEFNDMHQEFKNDIGNYANLLHDQKNDHKTILEYILNIWDLINSANDLLEKIADNNGNAINHQIKATRYLIQRSKKRVDYNYHIGIINNADLIDQSIIWIRENCGQEIVPCLQKAIKSQKSNVYNVKKIENLLKNYIQDK